MHATRLYLFKFSWGMSGKMPHEASTMGFTIFSKFFFFLFFLLVIRNLDDLCSSSIILNKVHVYYFDVDDTNENLVCHQQFHYITFIAFFIGFIIFSSTVRHILFFAINLFKNFIEQREIRI